MILYHGSNTFGLTVLEPRLANYDRPYVYMTTVEAVSAFYLCNAVERPYYTTDCINIVSQKTAAAGFAVAWVHSFKNRLSKIAFLNKIRFLGR